MSSNNRVIAESNINSQSNLKDLTAEELHIQNILLQQENAELNAKIKWYEEQYRLSKQKLYGKSSEKTIEGQISLFNEAEDESKPEAPEPTVEEITYKRRKKVGHREAQLKDLPVETIEYTLTEDEQACSSCGDLMHVMSKEIRKEIKVIPAQVSVVEHIRNVYSCRKCEKKGVNTPIKTASMPNPALPGSIASSSAISYVMTEKFVKSVPLYRQEQQWKQMDIGLSRQTMANWMIKSSERWLRTMYDRMRTHLLSKDIINADETTLQVLKEPDRSADSTSYMWLYRTGRDGPPIILYDYQTTRAGKHPKSFLQGYKGFLQSDGYQGYGSVPDVIQLGCWSHARRKFDEALKAMPKTQSNTPSVAQEGMNFCNKLFMIERELHDVSSKERYDMRLIKSKPIIEDFKAWLKYHAPRVLPKSAIGIAIRYCRNQMEKLEVFLMDGRLEVDNNRSERAIKPFVIGRKNFLFCNSQKGATSSATIYSIIETAKENKLKVFEYLKYLFDTLPNIDIKNPEELDKLLPWSLTLPDNLKVEQNKSSL